MEYYLFRERRLARSQDGSLGNYEWLINGEWKEDTDMSRALNDARVDFGDYSPNDYDDITPEIAEELIQNGTVVLYGSAIQLNNWKEPSEQIQTKQNT